MRTIITTNHRDSRGISGNSRQNLNQIVTTLFGPTGYHPWRKTYKTRHFRARKPADSATSPQTWASAPRPRVDEQPEHPTRPIKEIVAAGWQNRDRADNVRCLVRRIQRLDQEMSGAARDLFAAFVPEGT
jgi:hypothetical protein